MYYRNDACNTKTPAKVTRTCISVDAGQSWDPGTSADSVMGAQQCPAPAWIVPLGASLSLALSYAVDGLILSHRHQRATENNAKKW